MKWRERSNRNNRMEKKKRGAHGIHTAHAYKTRESVTPLNVSKAFLPFVNKCTRNSFVAFFHWCLIYSRTYIHNECVSIKIRKTFKVFKYVCVCNGCEECVVLVAFPFIPSNHFLSFSFTFYLIFSLLSSLLQTFAQIFKCVFNNENVDSTLLGEIMRESERKNGSEMEDVFEERCRSC